MDESNIYLTILYRSKGIPYGGGDRPDGSINHGYKRLKGQIDLAASIPEAQDMEALKSALVRLNDRKTAFFTVGCEKSCDKYEGGFSTGGYIELAFNYVELAMNAQWYFKIFFDFTKLINGSESQASRTRYIFELAPAHFLDGPADGFTLTVWIKTSLFTTREESLSAWGQSLSLLVQLLESMDVGPNGTPIYTPGKPYAAILMRE
jgi:hypothetical protein